MKKNFAFWLKKLFYKKINIFLQILSEREYKKNCLSASKSTRVFKKVSASAIFDERCQVC